MGSHVNPSHTHVGTHVRYTVRNGHFRAPSLMCTGCEKGKENADNQYFPIITIQCVHAFTRAIPPALPRTVPPLAPHAIPRTFTHDEPHAVTHAVAQVVPHVVTHAVPPAVPLAVTPPGSNNTGNASSSATA